MASRAKEIKCGNLIQIEVEKIARSTSVAARLKERAKIVSLAISGMANSEIALKLGVRRATCSKWRMRFYENLKRLETVAETGDSKAVRQEICEILDDAARSGRPRTFQQEAVTQIMQMACQKPEEHSMEASHWTCSLLAKAAVQEGIVADISSATVSRYLEQAAIAPWKSRYWLHSVDKEKDPEGYAQKVNEICETYRQAGQTEGRHTVCIDEMTGIQALERKYPDKPVRPGSPCLREFEYIRHGTVTLIGGFDVTTGSVFSPFLNKTRKEEDFVNAISQMVETDPDGEWVFVLDGLNIHKSEALVRFVAEHCGIEDDLGVKGRRGVLQNMRTREAFLHSLEHRIRFIYTPCHCSWMNQIEIWFSKLSRRLLAKSSFCSVSCLMDSIRSFVDQHNATAKPFRWTYSGVPLAA